MSSNYRAKRQVSISSLISEAVKDLRMAGNEFVASHGKNKTNLTKRNQDAFASAIGVKKAFYSELESGQKAFNIIQLNQICDSVDFPLGSLFSYVDYMKEQVRLKKVEVVNEKLPIHLDLHRRGKKIEEKARASFNKWSREAKKDGSYRLLSPGEIEEQRKKFGGEAEKWFKQQYESDEMLSYVHSAAYHGEDDGDLHQ